MKQLTTLRKVGGQVVTVPAIPWYKSKQIWLGIISSAVGIFSILENQYGLAVFTTIVGILQVVFRTLSSTAIVSSEDQH